MCAIWCLPVVSRSTASVPAGLPMQLLSKTTHLGVLGRSGSRLAAFSPVLRAASGRRISRAVLAMAKKDKKKDEGGPYSATVKVPVTSFGMRANAPVREPEIQAFWEQKHIYESLVESNPGEPYTLHDGPPYANGDLHIGHALNKILKDFINRYQLLQGRRARFVPGWDTHGLPIELKVLQALPAEERKSLDTLGLRKAAREYALKAVEAQKAQFKRYGVWGDWSSPYVTLDPSYEAAQLGVFGAMVLRGHVYRGKKPVHWSPSSRTALAEAELEYPEGHKSRSIYVAMPITELGPNVPAEAAHLLSDAAFAIWTTTPWTIPANLAVAVNGALDYAVVEASPGDATLSPGDDTGAWMRRRLVVAEALVEELAGKLGVPLRKLGSFSGANLEGCSYQHPLAGRTSNCVVGGDYITTDSGTGLVHTAPGHGQEDYIVGLRCGLPLLSPVDDEGRFTAEAGEAFAGLPVLKEGNAAVIAALQAAGALLKEESYEHKYPYDWRTKQPTIFRATEQWFTSVDGFRDAALEAIGKVEWVPAVGANRISAMTQSRSDWCISRQRKWGVPIPAFYNKETGEALMTAETISHIQSIVAAQGSDAWWTLPIEQLLPASLAHLAPTLVKGEDTMDVWFDSGSSWAGVVQATEGLRFPADLYLEGSDQHRGWFQSSLLTSIASNGAAPYRTVLTHGFVLDERGYKMSKSLGNVVDPRSVMDGGKDAKANPPYGADVLRLWVASVDYSNDVMIGPGIIKQVSESYRKLRGTLRYLLGNLADYDAAATPDYESLPAVDRWLLCRHAAVMAEVAEAYQSYQFRRALGALLTFISGDLSSFYLDITKDRMYIQGTASASRRACQAVQAAVLRGLLSGLAPLIPHTAEDAWLNAPAAVAGDVASVFGAGRAAPEAAWSSLPQEELSMWSRFLGVREAVNSALERARSERLIGSSLEACLSIHVSDPALAAWMEARQASGNAADELRYLLIASEVRLVSSEAETSATSTTSDAAGCSVAIGVSRAAGAKCARCWNYSAHVGEDAGHAELCERCSPVVREMGFQLPGAAAAKGKQAAVAAA